MRFPFLTIPAAVIVISLSATARAEVPAGYEKLRWGTEFAKVVKQYPKGSVTKMHEDVIYRQQSPSKTIARRLFGFRGGKLYTVSITYDKGYVQKTGIEKLLAEQKKRFGEARVDSSQAPHMVNCVWEGKETRVTFAYAPKRPDMTVIMFDQKP